MPNGHYEPTEHDSIVKLLRMARFCGLIGEGDFRKFQYYESSAQNDAANRFLLLAVQRAGQKRNQWVDDNDHNGLALMAWAATQQAGINREAERAAARAVQVNLAMAAVEKLTEAERVAIASCPEVLKRRE